MSVALTSHSAQRFKTHRVIVQSSDHFLQTAAELISQAADEMVVSPIYEPVAVRGPDLVTDHQHCVAALHCTAGKRRHGTGSFAAVARRGRSWCTSITCWVRVGKSFERLGDVERGL